MSFDLREAVAIVTGAGSGIGRNITLELAARGARVVAAGRRPEPLAALAEEAATAGGAVVAIPTDVTRGDDRAELVAQAIRAWGQIDILVNSAAVGRAAPFLEEDAGTAVTTNLIAPMALTREVLPGMLEHGRGHILNVSSLAVAGLPYVVQYSASKAGLANFSTALREELRGTGVSTTVVAPGFIVDEGMYAPYETAVPWYLGSNYSQRVALKALRAMERDRASVIINKMPVRPLLALQAMSENAFRAVTRALGLRSYLKGLSARGVDYSGRQVEKGERAA